MADTVTPSSGNPYLALLQQEQGPPTLAQILQHIGNLGFGLAGGFSQAASGGQSIGAGIGPGLMMGNQLNAQAAQQAEQARQKRLELQFQAQGYEDKRAEAIRKQKALEDFAKTGFSVAPQQGPLMGPGGTPSATTQPGPDLKTAGAPLVNYLVAQHGLSPLAAATIAGNLYQESGFNPAATGDSGSAFGMAQWRLDRQDKLRAFAAAQPGGPKPATDPQVQIDYLVTEMKGGDMGAQRAYAMLQQAKTPEQANAAMMHFFRPAGYTPANPTGGHGFGNRVANTRALLPQDRPIDQATAPVPTVDPYAVSAPPSGPAPRPGLGPRATPPGPDGPQGPVTPGGSPFDPNAQPPPFVAQGGGEGEVVLPRIGLPFPAQAPAPAPPGSVPFPAVPGQPAPAGPNVVQPNYNPPQPGQPTMAPGGAPAPGGVPGIEPPPVRPVTPMPGPDPAFAAQVRAGVLAGIIKPDEGLNLLRQNAMDRYKQVDAAIDAQHGANLEVYKQQQEGRRHERGLAEQRAAAERQKTEDQRKHAQSQQEEGEWLYINGVRTWVPKAKRTEGMTSEEAPKDKYEVVTPQAAQMELGPAYNPAIAYQRNVTTRKIEPIRTGPDTQVNIDQKSESEFAKEMGKVDAKRFGDIIQAEGTMNDMASKLNFALSQFQQTYTGPGAETANAFYKTLGSFGFPEAANKANAAEAAVAVISQMKPAMRAPGTGSSSDRDMDTFAAALPSLLNLPGGNERITAYFQRMADRATRVRELAQEHSEGGKVPLTRTGFDTAVKNLGRLFSEDEIKEMTALGKQKAPTGPKPPISSFGTPQQTPAPPGSITPRPPIGSFGGGG